MSIIIKVVITAMTRDYKKVDSIDFEQSISNAKDLALHGTGWHKVFKEFKKKYSSKSGFPSDFFCDFAFYAPISQKEEMKKQGFFNATDLGMTFNIVKSHTVLFY